MLTYCIQNLSPNNILAPEGTKKHRQLVNKEIQDFKRQNNNELF